MPHRSSALNVVMTPCARSQRRAQRHERHLRTSARLSHSPAPGGQSLGSQRGEEKMRGSRVRRPASAPSYWRNGRQKSASKSTGITPPNGGSSSKRSEASTSLPDANPASQQFLVQDTPPAPIERPPSQDAPRKGAPRPPPPASRLTPSATDLSGINVFQLELRQQPPPAPPNGANRIPVPPPTRPSVPAPSSTSSSVATIVGKAPKRGALNAASTAANDGGTSANSAKAPPDVETETASASSFSGSVPRLVNPRVNGTSAPPPQLQLSATHMTVSTRKPSRQLPLPAPSKSSDAKFGYPDPVVGANNSFHQRISEMAVLEADTVRWERARMFRRKPRYGRQD